MQFVCLDVEGVLLPELWMVLGNKFGLAPLLETTRDTPDLARLMAQRIDALRGAGIGYADVLDALKDVEPLDGAREFLDHLCQVRPVMLVSDSFYELLLPQLKKLGRPSVICNTLNVDPGGFFCGWQRRLPDQKPAAVRALQSLGFEVVAAGDSFNDIGMLKAADLGCFINAPDAICALHPDIPRCNTLPELKNTILSFGSSGAQSAMRTGDKS